jgi:aspartyl-tRNA(Asn)/glutamyl-tRNA(Gln) amidotransferase subunit A
MTSMADWTVADVGRALRDGKVTAAALAEDAIARQEKFGRTIGSYMRFLPDEARRAAKAADAAFAVGADLGPLQGIPVSVKDLFGMEGLPIYAGSAKELPEKFRAEGPLVRRLRQQLAVIVGRTHTSEFAYGEYGYGTNSQHHTPRNPWDPVNVRPPGGSSSGAATSLCEGTALVGIGSDTTATWA